MAIDVILTPQSLGRAVLAMGDAKDAILALQGQDPALRFDLVVFTSREDPAPPQVFKDGARRVRVFSVNPPLTDTTSFSADQAFAAQQAAVIIAEAFKKGERILITSSQGRNRAGLVAALAVRNLTHMDGPGALRWVRMRRVHVLAEALTNGRFVSLLENLPRKLSTEPPTVSVSR